MAAHPASQSASRRRSIIHRPAHDVTIGVVFRALTREPLLLARVLAARALPAAEQPAAQLRLDKAQVARDKRRAR